MQGHCGELVFGTIAGTTSVCMRGRFHFYEGNNLKRVAVGVRLMKLLGCKFVILTNAAGGLNQSFKVGDLMIISDHLNLPGMAGFSPLIGPNEDLFGTRFPAMSDAYDESLRALAYDSAIKLGYEGFVHPEGVYAFVAGPCYETAAECQFLVDIGGDSVGMSTAPEVVAAKHAGLRVLGLSVITDMVALPGSSAPPTSHAEVLAAVEVRKGQIQALVKDIVGSLGAGHDGHDILIAKKKKQEADRVNNQRLQLVVAAAFAATLLFLVKRGCD